MGDPVLEAGELLVLQLEGLLEAEYFGLQSPNLGFKFLLYFYFGIVNILPLLLFALLHLEAPEFLPLHRLQLVLFGLHLRLRYFHPPQIYLLF